MMYAVYIDDKFSQSLNSEFCAIFWGSLFLSKREAKSVSVLEVETGEPVIDLSQDGDFTDFYRHKEYSGT